MGPRYGDERRDAADDGRRKGFRLRDRQRRLAKSERPVLLWSPDSRRISTFQQDERTVSDMYLVSTNVGKPKLQAWKYPLPGDKDVAMIHRVIIEVDTPKVVRLQIPPDPHRSTLCDDIVCGGSFDDNEWSEDRRIAAKSNHVF